MAAALTRTQEWYGLPAGSHPFYSYQVDGGWREFVTVDLRYKGGRGAKVLYGRGGALTVAAVELATAEGIALCRAMNEVGDSRFAAGVVAPVLADFVEESGPGAVWAAWPFKADSAALVAAALRRCG